MKMKIFGFAGNLICILLELLKSVSFKMRDIFCVTPGFRKESFDFKSVLFSVRKTLLFRFRLRGLL